MKSLILATSAAALLIGAATIANAADRPGEEHAGWGKDMGAGHHWKQGEHLGYNDWHNAPAVDYRQHHLRAPPAGYEWREVNGQYVLAAVATGIIASIMLSAGH